MPDLLELGQLGGIGVLFTPPFLRRPAKLRSQLAGFKKIEEGGRGQVYWFSVNGKSGVAR